MILESVKNIAPFARSHSLSVIMVAFMSTALASSTLGNYAPHEEAYFSFCEGFGVLAPFPLSCGVLCAFLCHYFQLQKPFSAIKTALAAVRNLAITLGHDISALSSERLGLAKRAYEVRFRTGYS